MYIDLTLKRILSNHIEYKVNTNVFIFMYFEFKMYSFCTYFVFICIYAVFIFTLF